MLHALDSGQQELFAPLLCLDLSHAALQNLLVSLLGSLPRALCLRLVVSLLAQLPLALTLAPLFHARHGLLLPLLQFLLRELTVLAFRHARCLCCHCRALSFALRLEPRSKLALSLCCQFLHPSLALLLLPPRRIALTRLGLALT